jgi:hypothetical protein
MINRQQFEAQLQHIFRLLLQNKTQEEIAHELNISTRTVARYSQCIDSRYGEAQRQKTNDTLFLEISLLKNRLLKLYKSLEDKVVDPEASCSDIVKCADVAAGIATSVIKLESEGIRAVKELSRNVVNQNTFTALNKLRNDNNDSDESSKECDPNRKF